MDTRIVKDLTFFRECVKVVIINLSAVENAPAKSWGFLFSQTLQLYAERERLKRVVAISDLHVGHVVGLTHPDFQSDTRYRNVQSKLWNYYATVLDSLQPIDILFVCGDAIDGQSKRSGMTECFIPDIDDQIYAAAKAIKYARAGKIVMVHGTPYHVARDDGSDAERAIAEMVGADIEGHAYVDVDGVLFDLKHKVGSASNPVGRHTSVARENLWSRLWQDYGMPRGKNTVILRGHVHYHNYCGGPGWLGMTLPALQGTGSKFGVRQCSGICDYGLVSFDVDQGGYTWTPHLCELRKSNQVIKC